MNGWEGRYGAQGVDARCHLCPARFDVDEAYPEAVAGGTVVRNTAQAREVFEAARAKVDVRMALWLAHDEGRRS